MFQICLILITLNLIHAFQSQKFSTMLPLPVLQERRFLKTFESNQTEHY